MTLSALTPAEREVVRRMIAATFDFFDDNEFHCRIGVGRDKMRYLLTNWKVFDDSDDHSDACLAVNNSLNDLLNGVGISEEQAVAIAGVSCEEIDRIYCKWALARGWNSTGVR